MNVVVRLRGDSPINSSAYVKEQIERMCKNHTEVTSAHLDAETHSDGTICNLALKGEHLNLAVSSHEENFSVALDEVVEKAERTLRKHKEQINEISNARTDDEKFATHEALSNPKEIVLPNSVRKIDADDIVKFESARIK